MAKQNGGQISDDPGNARVTPSNVVTLPTIGALLRPIATGRQLADGEMTPLAFEVFTSVADAARDIPNIQAAYVSLDGTRFAMTGTAREGAAYEAVARAVLKIRDRFAGRIEIDGDYVPCDTRPISGYYVAFVR